MRTLPVNLNGTTYDFAFTKNNYAVDGSLAVDALADIGDGMEPFASVTVCLNVPLPDRNWAFVDSNNLHGIEDALEGAGLAVRTGYRVQSGFCTYEAMEFTPKFFEIAV
jgi:hypothetical protein